MKTWSLEKFVKEHSCKEAGLIWGVTHQAVSKAVRNGRDVTIVLNNGVYSAHQNEELGSITVSKFKRLRKV